MPKHLTVLAALVVTVVALAAATTSAAAAGPYLGGQTGYDIGWPQCGSAFPTGSFGVVGISSGRPFDVDNGSPNPCLAAEYASQPDHGLYLNTGYDPVYWTEHAAPTCAQLSASAPGDIAHQQAWAIGCSWAEAQQRYASQVGATPPVAWWLDVETANSWSTTDLSLNAEAIQGGVDRLRSLTPGIPVGVYSTSAQWTAVTGSSPVSGLASDWVATGQGNERRAARFCGAGFTGDPVWLVQWRGTVDHDLAC